MSANTSAAVLKKRSQQFTSCPFDIHAVAQAWEPTPMSRHAKIVFLIISRSLS
jgi:hypothetical protein